MEYSDNMPSYSSSLEVIDPGTLFTDGYELTNQTVIESTDYQGSFTPGINNCEFYIYDGNKNLIISDYNFTGITVPNNPNPQPSFDPKTGITSYPSTQVNLNPENDIVSQGFTFGKMYAVYNFVNLELGSSMEVPYYLAEISSDRTEIRLKSNFISTRVMKSTTVALKNALANPLFFDEIYISFGNNEYHIGVNIKYDDTLDSPSTKSNIKSANAIGQSSILIKLFDPLPPKYSLLDELYVCTKTAESQAYLVNFVNDFKTDDEIIKLKGPNSNLKIKDFVNAATDPKSKSELLGTKSSGSKDQLLNVLNQTGVQLTPNYSTASFGEFINFSSAKSQVSNFAEKVARIQSYEADLDSISQTTGSNVGNIPISKSMASLWTKIEDEITSFSGFEYYQYYSTGSDAYPKTGTVFPFELLPTQSNLAQNWITAAEFSGSLFDGDNQNWLYYTVPGFIKDNSSNDNYLEFVNMVGQSFDEVWLYTKAIAEKSNTTNQLDKGVPLQLADDVITSLGYTGFGNNYNNQDNFIGLIGNDNGDYLPPTGSELINHYIAVNGPGGVINYWDDGYSWEDYVESIQNLGFPYPIDKVSKEIFKRLYHNMSYLVKKKGTVSGLRQLINIWGIPNTILRINEFGGKNKDEEDDYDLWYQRYSYAYTPVPAGTNYASSSVRIPWQPLYRNYIHSHNKLITSTISATGTTLTGAANNKTSAAYGIDTQFTVTGGGSGGTLTLTSDGSGEITTVNLTQGDSNGYNEGSIITISAAQINALNDSQLGTSLAGGPATFVLTNANLGAEQIVPDGLGFRFKTIGYPSSSYGGNFDSQSLFIKKSTNSANDADVGIALYYTGSTSGSYQGSTSSAYKDYGEMRFFIKGDANGGGTAMSPPIYLPFFDKGWWSVQLQRDEHPIVTNNVRNTAYTLYVANKIYDGADGNQIGFQGSASIYVNVANNLTTNGPGKGPSPLYNANSASVNKSWNDFSLDLAAYGAGAYLGGWGNTLVGGSTGSIGTLSVGGTKGVQNAGKNFSGSLQEFRYYSHDISQSVFNDFVMNPESIEGNFITGSESSFDIVNFRAPLGNELESRFTSSEYDVQYIDQQNSVHPAVTGSSPLIVTASFYNPSAIPFLGGLTSSYDVTFNVNTSTRTYSEPNVETYFLDQPSIGIRNRISNKIKYSTNLNFGTTLSNKVSIQQNPPVSQSYTDNINSLEVAFSPTEEINDDIIQTLGYGAIQEVIADPRFRSSSDDYYPGLQEISKAYFKKYTNRNQTDYLRLIKYFDDSLFKAIKNYVPARTSVSTGIVIKQNMLERSRYREPQVDIVTTQSYAPFNQPLTAKNLEITGNIETNQLWDPLLQTTYYSASDVYNFEAGPGGSVNQYNILEEGGGLYILESDDLSIGNGKILTGVKSGAGSGYSTATTYPTSGGSGTGATIRVDSLLLGAPFGVTVINPGQNYKPGDVLTIVGGNNLATYTIFTVYNTSLNLLESLPLEEAAKDIVYVNAGPIQPQAEATITFGHNVETQPNGASDDAHSIQLISINPTDGSTITKKYCASSGTTGVVDGDFIQWDGTGTNGTKAAAFAAAVNSTSGQGSGAATPTIYAERIAGTANVLLRQLYGGTDGNTSITYGSKIVNTFGYPNLWFDFQGGNNGGATSQNGVSTDLTGLTVNLTFASGTGLTNGVTTVGSTPRASVGDTVNFTSIVNPKPNPNSAKVSAVSSVTVTNPNFLGGASTFENVFLNALKSVQTPVYVDYNFSTFTNPTDITLTVSSSKRGNVMTNTTTYTQADPPGSILNDSLFDMHPGEDIYFIATSDEDVTIDNFQLILGENITITRAFAAQTTSNVNTLRIDNIDPVDKLPVVGATVTGPDIKAGVVTVLGAVTSGGTGYDPSTTQVLATRGAGGGNLTLNVTTNSSGVVTTASLVGGNPGTNYTSGDIVTIVGGDNNAKVAITTASSKTCTVTAFNPTIDQVTFNQVQSIANNSKVTFTVPNVIPNNDTVPVSQQGYFEYNVTPLGIDTIWDSTQEQFYDGEYSGSEINVETREQYNPYRKVKGNSIPVAETNITLDTNNDPAAALKNGLAISSNTVQGNFTFNATAGVNNTYPFPLFFGITKEELIPYQTYRVQCTITLSAGMGNSLGIFYENYGYNGIEYNPYPGVVSSLSTLSNAGADYTVGGGYQTVATNPVIVAAGSGYSDGTFETTGGNGAGQTVTITQTGGAIQTVTLVNPGSGYLRSDVLTIVGGNNDGTVNVGKGGVVVEITEVSAAGGITGITKINVQNGGNGAYQKSDALTIIGGNGAAQFSINSPASTAANGVSTLGTVRPVNTDPVDIDFTFKFLPPLSADTSERGRYGLSFYAVDNTLVGTLSNLIVTGIGGIYENVEAPIFLTQQDEGYDNQMDYQNMGPTDILGNVISPINLIQNTQSVVFNNSEYNPLSNNVNTNRSSSYRYVLSYGATQSVPNNFDLVVTQSYFPTSPSGTFPELADVPDSNYTMPSSVNSRYGGTKLKSLDYNFFTPSGSVGPGVSLKVQPLNKGRNPISARVATEFLDGSVTSSFQQTPLGAGSASWQGDGPLKNQAVIDKHPIYMARFENSYEQLNLYNSYQFNIDQLIEVPMENIAGAEVTPNSITIDGSNENKKIVSSVFEPKRKLQVSYLNPKTPAIDYTTMQIGNYDILSGATEFLTINSNAKSRVSASLAYNYTRGGQLVTSSLTQDQGTIQMVTGSNRIGDPATEGQLDTTAKLAFVSGQVGSTTYTSLTVAPLIPTGLNIGELFPSDDAYPLQSMGGPGSGGSVKIVINTSGEVIASYGGSFTGDVVDSGTGYVQGQTVKVQIEQKTGTPIEIFFVISSTEILANPNSIVSNGFILSGSLTTGNVPAVGNSSIITGTILSFLGGTGGTQTVGTIVVPTTNYYLETNPASANYNRRIRIAEGSGATVAVTSDGTEVTSVVVVDGGSGYRPGDNIGIFADVLNDVNNQGPTGRIFIGASAVLAGSILLENLEGSSSPFQLNFNPSAISSSLVTSSLGAGATSTLEQQLLIGGPQLALFNMFNATVSSSLFDVNTIGSDLNEGPSSLLWTTSGSDPANTENYYNWAPESSDSNSYTNTNTPFLIERGDIIRVEGTLNTITAANVSQSTNIIQDFTVEELQPFNYTSSFAEVYNFNYLKTTTLSNGSGITNITRPSAPSLGTYTNIAFPVMTTNGNGKGAVLTVYTGGTNPPEFNDFTFTSIGNGYKAGDVMTVDSTFITGLPNFSFELTSDAFNTPGGIQNTLGFQAIKNGAFTQTRTKGTISAIPTAYQGKNRKFVCVINTDNSGTGAKMNLLSNTTGSLQNVGGTVTAQIVCGTVAGGNSDIKEWSFTGGENIPEGTSFSIEIGNIKNNTYGWGTAATATAFQFEMINGCIVQQPSSNNFTFGVDVAASATSTPESGSQEGFHNYEKGEIGFTAPSFVRVTPDPTETLVGLPGGEVTKMTIRRQIEADDKVMVKNIEPPSGSLGIETQSGQGFLIPNDFSPIQKANALNIINQLKAKNAFDKPNEPGITDRLPGRIIRNRNNSGGNSGGGNSGGGGSGGIQ